MKVDERIEELQKQRKQYVQRINQLEEEKNNILTEILKIDGGLKELNALRGDISDSKAFNE